MVVCPFVLFLLAIVLSVLLRCTDSDYLPLVSLNSSCSFFQSQSDIIYYLYFVHNAEHFNYFMEVLCRNPTNNNTKDVLTVFYQGDFCHVPLHPFLLNKTSFAVYKDGLDMLLLCVFISAFNNTSIMI
jgi:hypothetical protein